MNSNPTNKTLYNKIKKQAKNKFKVWPSAYASGWMIKEYKRLGGKFGSKFKKYNGLSRWYEEEWINVCKLPNKVSCGRKKSTMKNYPYCRPSKRITSKTPKTSTELSKKEIKSRCSRKKRSPRKRIY
jgi:hypothetical protein